jgi:uncharacterized protein YkwD
LSIFKHYQRMGKLALSGIFVALFIAGCGGGGGGDNSNGTQSTNSPTKETSGSTTPGTTVTPNPPSASIPSTPSAPSTPAPTTPTLPSTPTTPTTPTPEPTPVATLPAGTTCSLTGFQAEMLKLINQARANTRYCGTTFYNSAPPVSWNSKLFNAAAGHSADMAQNNYFSHTSQDGRTFSQRIAAAGYTARAAGENIAAGQANVALVMEGWLQSPGHCANIMNGTYTEVGVSCVQNNASTYKKYWTMELGTPR